MTIVAPPYLLDFGKAYLDEQAPYTPEQRAEWRASLKRSFPKADLRRIEKILRILQGIDDLDARPWNIRLRSDRDERALSDDDWEGDFDGPPLAVGVFFILLAVFVYRRWRVVRRAATATARTSPPTRLGTSYATRSCRIAAREKLEAN